MKRFFFLSTFLILSQILLSTTIVYLRLVDAISLDPAYIQDIYSAEIGYNVYDTLVNFDNCSLRIIPSLAISWKTTDDGKTWIFDLRKNVKFSDGTPFTSYNVVYSFYDRFKEGGKSDITKIIKKVIPIDRYKVKIILNEFDYGFISRLLDINYAIIKKGNRIRGTNFLGTGPFVLKKWDKRKRIVLLKNRRYWKKEVRTDKIIINFAQNTYDKILRFQNGESDLVRINTRKEENLLLSEKKVNYFENKSLLVYYLGFNLNNKPFNNILVRKAFAKMINKKNIINYIFQDLAIPTSTFVPFFIKGANKNIKDYKYDIGEARKMLKEAGYKDGFTINLLIRKSNDDIRELAASIGKIALKTGVKIKIEELPYVDLINRLKQKKFDSYIAGFVSPPDAELYLEPIASYHGFFNFTGFKNESIYKLLKLARKSLGKKREDIYYKIQKIVHKDIPIIPLFILKSKIVSKKDISGIKISPLRIILFEDAFRKN